MESEGNEILTLQVDATGDPKTATLPVTVAQDQLPFEIPSDLILNGRQHVVDVPLLPIWLIYVGSAQAVKGGEPGSITVGESIDVKVFVKLYVRLPLPLTPAQKLAEITLNYSGNFTSAAKAEGQSDVKVELTGIADFLAGLADVPAEELQTPIGDTDLVKQ